MNKILFPRPKPSYTYNTIQERYPNSWVAFVPRSKSPYQLIPILVSLFTEFENSMDSYLLFFHANAEDLGLSLPFLQKLKHSLRVNVIAMEYSTYGISEDKKMNVDTLKQDASDVYEYMVNQLRIDESKILVMGRSIGTGLALDLCAKKTPRAVLLVSPFTSIKALAANVCKGLNYLVGERFDNLKQAKQLKSRCLIVHGKADKLIDYKHSEDLEKASPYIQTIFPENMTHNKFDFRGDLLEPINQFLGKDYSQIRVPIQQLNDFFKNKPKGSMLDQEVLQQRSRVIVNHADQSAVSAKQENVMQKVLVEEEEEEEKELDTKDKQLDTNHHYDPLEQHSPLSMEQYNHDTQQIDLSEGIMEQPDVNKIIMQEAVTEIVSSGRAADEDGLGLSSSSTRSDLQKSNEEANVKTEVKKIKWGSSERIFENNLEENDQIDG